MKTNFETLKSLAIYVVDVLKENRMIEFESADRERIIEAMATEFAVSFATDEDIAGQALEEVEEKLGLENIPRT